MNKPCLRFFLTLFFAVNSLIFAENLKVLKTKYFDIIYTPQSEKTAALIYKHADEYAEEISARLGKNKPWRMPVYISPDSENLNGYYMPIPYQRIVIYDTTAPDGYLGNSYDSVLNVFYHELTHAISLFNYLPALPLSFAEGAAVLFESRDNQGRLNDPLIYHHLMQNKIDGTTPDWKQAAGHRDVYPAAFWAYLYGSAFSKYIEDIYGKELYGKLWHSHFFIFPKSKTKHIFGKPLDKLWKDFTDSIYYPEEFIVPENFSYGKKSGFKITAQNNDGFACYDFNEDSVFFYEKNGTARRLFYSPAHITDLNFSSDGKKLLVADLIKRNGKTRQRLSVFDMEKNVFSKKEFLSVRYAAFSSDNEICAIKVKNQFSEIILTDLNFNEKEILFSAGPGLPYSHIYNTVFAGENKTAFIAANGLKRDILVLDTKTKKIKKLTFKEDLEAVRFLRSNFSKDGITLTFSWSGKDKLYRTAAFNLDTSSLRTLDENISGGVFQAALIENENGKNLAYIGIHGKYNKIYKLDTSVLKEKKAVLLPLNAENVPAVSTAPDTENLNPKKYYYSSWFWRVLPFPALKLPGDLKAAGKYGYGVSFFAQDPTELLTLNATSLFYPAPFFAQFNVSLSVKKEPFRILMEVHDENVSSSFRRTGFSASFNSHFPLNRMEHNLSAGAQAGANWFAPFSIKTMNSKTLYGGKFLHSVFSSSVFAQYSFLKTRYRLGSNFFAIDSYGLYCTVKLSDGVHVQSKTNAFTMQAKTVFLTPVVPLKIALSAYYGYKSFFRPSAGDFSFYNGFILMSVPAYLPSMPEYAGVRTGIKPGKHNTGLGLDLTLTVFSYEIQTGSNFLPIFYNRINFELGYASALNILGLENKKAGAGKAAYFHSLYGNIFLDISGAAKLGVRYAHPLEKNVIKKIGRFSLLFSLDL